MKINRKGFTLVEIMIVVAIIAILAVIAIPNFIKSREESQKSACINNLKQIDGAVEQAMLAGEPSPNESHVIGQDKYIKVMPTCPTTKTPYTIAQNPVCPTTVEGHVLPTAPAAPAAP